MAELIEVREQIVALLQTKTLLDEKDWKIAAVLSGEIKPAKGE